MLLPEMRAERPQRRALAVSASSVGGQRQPSPRHDANKCRGVNKHVTIHHDDERRGRSSPGSLQARKVLRVMRKQRRPALRQARPREAAVPAELEQVEASKQLKPGNARHERDVEHAVVEPRAGSHAQTVAAVPRVLDEHREKVRGQRRRPLHVAVRSTASRDASAAAAAAVCCGGCASVRKPSCAFGGSARAGRINASALTLRRGWPAASLLAFPSVGICPGARGSKRGRPSCRARRAWGVLRADTPRFGAAPRAPDRAWRTAQRGLALARSRRGDSEVAVGRQRTGHGKQLLGEVSVKVVLWQGNQAPHAPHIVAKPAQPAVSLGEEGGVRGGKHSDDVHTNDAARRNNDPSLRVTNVLRHSWAVGGHC
mmetsp:Transcript_25256/g.95420  ORF Transcript_25256/g.95420 Transcript_25256/m.95420 type:complete len:371 (-) Transcript_25256:1034-2146(-)